MEDVEVPKAKRPARIKLLRIPCPQFWLLDCNTYTASIYLGVYGLRQVLRRHPKTRWFIASDDDLYLNPYALAYHLRNFDSANPMCLGNFESTRRPLLGFWSGIVCSNAAVRLLDKHLELATRDAVLERLGYTAGDFMISKCLWDLGVPLFHIQGFFGGHWPFPDGIATQAATFHRVTRRQDFERLDH